MATNNFKAFATGAGANVMTQADWEALPALLSGFSSGKAASAQVNKALRQASFIAAAVAQYVSTTGNVDVLDDGNLSGFITKFGNAVSGRLINIRVLTSSGSYTPTAGTKKIKVTAIGGGGGSGGLPATSSSQFSASGGGAGGSATISLIDVNSLTFPLSYTVGAGGAAGPGSPVTSNGRSGGNTTFGPLTAPGGGRFNVWGSGSTGEYKHNWECCARSGSYRRKHTQHARFCWRICFPVWSGLVGYFRIRR
ncbi:glycine-rich domain-containing protein [Enterobacter kobei]|uniref:glycine-rich domain-containing protein n=1 Tax=Enterobacter kobei TaxID=208224 RepID=UPI003AAD949E